MTPYAVVLAGGAVLVALITGLALPPMSDWESLALAVGAACLTAAYWLAEPRRGGRRR